MGSIMSNRSYSDAPALANGALSFSVPLNLKRILKKCKNPGSSDGVRQYTARFPSHCCLR
jgi:hypothetical protein